MRFGTVAGRMVLVEGDRMIDVAERSAGQFSSNPVAALADWTELRSWAATLDWVRSSPVGELGPPVPTPRQVFAVALNYRPHAEEAGFVAPEQPLVFTKFPSCIDGPGTTVELPDGKVDWEVEIVAVIGGGGHNIARRRAWDAIAGLTLGQDLSERTRQLAGNPPQFSLAKSFPGFGPIGPLVLAPEEFADPEDIEFECLLGNEVVQHARTSEMIFPIADLTAYISGVCRLLPGDLIFTGTPAGVGNRRVPPRYVAPGETLISRADEIGEIWQTFVAADSEE